MDLDSILARKHQHPVDSENSLMDIRVSLLSSDISDKRRCMVWKLLLRVQETSAAAYVSLVSRGPSAMYDKIRNDAFRTLATDEQFLESVTEAMLIRALNSFIWISSPEGEANDSVDEHKFRCLLRAWFPANGITYVQGMNVVVAPFLKVMPEMDAFFAFSTFIWKQCPLYVQPNMIGVHCAAKLVDLCLKKLDPQLYYFLLSKGLTANIYALPSLVTFSACTPPLDQVLLLWDIMFSYGIHLSIFFVIAQVALMRDELLASASPMKLLRKFPPLHAAEIVKITRACMRNLPPDLYDQLVRHATDASVAKQLSIATSVGKPNANNEIPAYLTRAL
ncbi:rab-GTPase-TBC domain-containing protein [Gongronella butleri]|nr:rab-GTPase-TBC domain-containing protein [Gongronella butleri]